MEDWQQFYATQGIVTDPGEHGVHFNGLPNDIPSLCKIVQGLILHMHWAEGYGVKLSQERRDGESNLRSVSHQLKRILGLDDSPLTRTRSLEKKIIGNCRDFSVVLCTMLRYQGVPARARCGFGTYFEPDHYEDHWMCEYWNGDEARWVEVDAQLDGFQRGVLDIEFDPLDMPPGQFVTGGEAWQMCRAGEADPDKFGIFDMHGIWFVRGDLIRDFLSLNKVEILPWDGGWGFLTDEEDMEVGIMDRIARLALAGDGAFAEIRATYEDDSRFHVPDEWGL